MITTRKCDECTTRSRASWFKPKKYQGNAWSMLFRRVRATGFVSILKDLRRPRAHLFDELYLSQQHFFSAKASYTPAWYPCTAGGCTVTKHVRWSLSCHRLTASLHVIGQRGQPEDQRLLLCSGVVVTDKQAASTVSKLHVCLFRNLHIYMWSVAVAPA